jgi:glycosyltransferase A (GT-A) superfamily protein (DUF2064 family)
MTRTLITFAREPIAGRTKTRLCPPLDGATAAALCAWFLSDVLDTVRQELLTSAWFNRLFDNRRLARADDAVIRALWPLARLARAG